MISGRHLGSRGQSFQSSAAMLIAISAIVPSVFMVIPMVTAIIVAFAWPEHAADDKANQPQYKGAVRNALCVCHGRSYAADSTTNHSALMVTSRNRFVGAVRRLANKHFLPRHPLCWGAIAPVDPMVVSLVFGSAERRPAECHFPTLATNQRDCTCSDACLRRQQRAVVRSAGVYASLAFLNIGKTSRRAGFAIVTVRHD